MISNRPKLALIGGFLGAGKTTLLGQIARKYVAAGKRVGLITNDQAADLVDTQHLRSLGFAVNEVSGACFCCSFDDLISAADRLVDSELPDILIAEPVGSCTDLVATVVLPIRQILEDRFDVAPFGVLLKPSHGKRILGISGASGGEASKSGFSPQAEYIFRKQLEEADYLMIGRADTLSPTAIEEIRERIQELAPEVPVIAVSPKTGLGVDEVIGYLESPMEAGQRILDIDYDVYAAGEAELGWVNFSTVFTSEKHLSNDVSLDKVAFDSIQPIAEAISSESLGEIAHLKSTATSLDATAVANVTHTGGETELGLASGRQVAFPIELVINARVAMDPDQLSKLCERQVRKLSQQLGATMKDPIVRALRPGRPVPVHRVGQA